MRPIVLFISALAAGCIGAPPGTTGHGDAAHDASSDTAADSRSTEMGHDGRDSSRDSGGDTSDAPDVSADAAPDLSETPKRIPFKIPQGVVAERLTNFPLLVELDDDDRLREITNISFGDATATDNYPREIEEFAGEQGGLRCWVRIPEIRADQDTWFYLYPVDRPDRSDEVWEDYAAVWHFEQVDEMTGGIRDATGNGHLAMPLGTPEIDGGRIGNGVRFDGASEYFEVDSTDMLEPSNFTVSVWANVPELDPARNVGLISKPHGTETANSYQLWIGDQRTVYSWVRGMSTFFQGDSTLPVASWTYLAYSYDGMDVLQQIGSMAHAYSVAGPVQYDDSSVLIGADIDRGAVVGHLLGRIDEARIARRAFSSARMDAERRNVSDPGSFYEVGSLESF